MAFARTFCLPNGSVLGCAAGSVASSAGSGAGQNPRARGAGGVPFFQKRLRASARRAARIPPRGHDARHRGNAPSARRFDAGRGSARRARAAFAPSICRCFSPRTRKPSRQQRLFFQNARPVFGGAFSRARAFGAMGRSRFAACKSRFSAAGNAVRHSARLSRAAAKGLTQTSEDQSFSSV